MNYSRQTNEDKGAWFADDAGYFFSVDMAAEMMYMDLQNSTDTCLRIYYYCVFFEKMADGESPVLTAATVTAGAGAEEKVFEPQEVIIPVNKAARVKRQCVKMLQLSLVAGCSLTRFSSTAAAE